jgi:hypothetical protein
MTEAVVVGPVLSRELLRALPCGGQLRTLVVRHRTTKQIAELAFGTLEALGVLDLEAQDGDPADDCPSVSRRLHHRKRTPERET